MREHRSQNWPAKRGAGPKLQILQNTVGNILSSRMFGKRNKEW